MAEISIVIKAIDKTKAALGSIIGNFKSLDNQLSAANKKTIASGNIFRTILSPAVLGASLSVGGLVIGIRKSIAAFEKQEMATARLYAVMRNVIGATDGQIESLRKFAEEMQRATAFGNEQIESAMAMLGTFKLNAEQIKILTPLMLDMAAALEKTSGGTISLEQASIMLGKAFTIGLGPLRRVGVTITELQERQFKLANQQERVRILQDILNANFKGVARAAAETYSGRVRLLHLQFGDLMEIIGGVIRKALSPLIEKMIILTATGGRLDVAIKWLGAAIYVITSQFVNLLEALSSIFKWLRENRWAIYGLAGAITVALLPSLKSLAIAFISVTKASLIFSIKFAIIAAIIGGLAYLIMKHWGTLGPFFKDLFNAIIKGFAYLAIGVVKAVNFIIKAWNAIAVILGKTKIEPLIEFTIEEWMIGFEGLFSGLKIRAGDFSKYFKKVISEAGGVFLKDFNNIGKSAGKVFDGIGKAVDKTTDKVKKQMSAFDKLINSLVERKDYLKRIIDKIAEYGAVSIEVAFKIMREIARLEERIAAARGGKAMQLGGIVSKTGAYILHEGERVITRNTAKMGGGGIIVNVYGNVNLPTGMSVDNFAERLNRQIELASLGVR